MFRFPPAFKGPKIFPHLLFTTLILGFLLAACDSNSQPLLICNVPGGQAAASPAPITPSTPTDGNAGLGNGPKPNPSPTLPPIPAPTVEVPAPVQKSLDIVAQQACRSRNLSYKGNVGKNFMKREDLVKFQQEEFNRSNPPEEIAKYTKTLEVFGFVPQGFDFAATYNSLQSEQVLGFYDPATKKLYIIVEQDPNKVDPLVKFTAEHELTHALQDQNFDLQKVHPQRPPGSPEGNDDADFATLALLEGDAVNSQTLWLQEGNLSKADLDNLLEEIKKQSSTALDKAPLILKDTLSFPYDQGYTFVRGVYKKGGWNGVNKMFTEYTPKSTSQILHLEKYEKRVEPVKIEFTSQVDALGSGWKSIDINTMGELQAGILLKGVLSPDTATSAVSGWAGDRYQVLSNPQGKYGYLWRSQWDTISNAGDFFQAIKNYAKKTYNLQGEGGTTSKKTWETADLEVSMELKGNQVLVVVLPRGSGTDKVFQSLNY